MYLINLSIICYSFLCGLHWDQLHSFFTKCGISLVSESTFYRYLKNLVYPVTYDFWLRDQASIINDLKEGEKASGMGSKFAGDGRFDSPGWSAKFCTYVIQALRTKKIVGFMVACKHQIAIASSSSMEVFALKSLLNFLQNTGITISALVTDRSSSVRAMMATDFASVDHQFDAWHYVKSIKNNLIKTCKLKSCACLKPWIDSIVTMIWWSLDTSKGSEELAREKIMSILHHTTNNHLFPSFALFKKCAHGIIKVSRPWLNAASIAFTKLKICIFGKDNKNLEDLKHLTLCLQTSDIESFNSLILKYANKTYSYSWLSMFIRTCVAAIDWNSNTDREQKCDSSGNPLYRIKKDRFGKKSIAPVKVKKDFQWQTDIFDACVDAMATGNIPQHQYPVIQEYDHIDQGEFSKEEAIKKLQTRMQKNNL